MNSKRAIHSRKQQGKFMKCMKCPLHVLAGARDLCVKGLTVAGGGGNISYGNAMGCPTPQIPTISSRNFGGGGGGKVEAELRHSKCSAPPPACRKAVAFERIDEENPYDFGEGEKWVLLGNVQVTEFQEKTKLN
ncbi:hypothetical protein ABFS82_08G060100 [Erythranthe guttata]